MEAIEFVRPRESFVVVLEDEDRVRKKLVSKIGALPGVRCEGARGLREFRERVRVLRPEAVSVDLRLGKTILGYEAFKIAKEEGRDPAIVVYTRLRDQASRAREKGADAVLVKEPGGENLEEYQALVGQAVRTNLARQVRRSLLKLGHRVAELEAGSLISRPALSELRKLAREVALTEAPFDPEAQILRLLLAKCGWWKVFETTSYVSWPLLQKLGVLAKYVRLEVSELAKIMGEKEGIARGILEGGIVQATVGGLHEKAERLLSILSFVLRVSGYNPELMPRYWGITNLYASSLDRPPWEGKGLKLYLEETGAEGLSCALDWIRHDVNEEV